jgi:hypothetical protein
MKRDLICIAIAVVAIPLTLSAINVRAQEGDDQPRLSAARDQAIRECSIAAAKYIEQCLGKLGHPNLPLLHGPTWPTGIAPARPAAATRPPSKM